MSATILDLRDAFFAKRQMDRFGEVRQYSPNLTKNLAKQAFKDAAHGKPKQVEQPEPPAAA